MRTLVSCPRCRFPRTPWVWKALVASLWVLLALGAGLNLPFPARVRAGTGSSPAPMAIQLKVPAHLEVEPGDYLPLPVQIAPASTLTGTAPRTALPVPPEGACVRLQLLLPQGWEPVAGGSDGTEAPCIEAGPADGLPHLHFWTVAVPSQATPGLHQVVVRAGEETHPVPVRVLPRRHVTGRLPEGLAGNRGSSLVVPLEVRNQGNVEAHLHLQPLVPAGWHIQLLRQGPSAHEGHEGEGDNRPSTSREPAPPHGPEERRLRLAVGESRTLYWQLTPAYPFQGEKVTVAFRIHVHGEAGDGPAQPPQLVRGEIQLLPPPPSAIPRLSPARAPARLQLETLWAPSTGAAGSGSLLAVSRWQLSTRLPAPDPGAPGSLLLLRGRGPVLGPGRGKGDRRTGPADGFVMDEFLWQAPQGWRLMRRPAPETLSPLLEVRRPSLQWTDADGNLTLGVSTGASPKEPAAFGSKAPPSSPLALVRWTLPQGDAARLTFSHRGGDSQDPPAYSLDWMQALDEGRQGLGLSLALVTPPSRSPIAWAAQWRWHPPGARPDTRVLRGQFPGQQAPSLSAAPSLYGGFRWVQRDPGFQADAPLKDGSAWIGRRQGSTDLRLTADYQQLPHHGDVWRLALETHRPVPSAHPTHLRLRVQRLFPWPPWAEGGEAGSRDELRWHLYRSGRTHSVSLSGGWVLNPQPEWQARVTFRHRPGREGWWYGTIAQRAVAEATLPAGRRNLWEAGVGYVSRSPSGWQREVAVLWPLLSEGWRGSAYWRLAVSSPYQEGRRWRLAVEGGWDRGWRMGWHLSQPFTLPLPLPAPQGQLTGRLQAPSGAADPPPSVAALDEARPGRLAGGHARPGGSSPADAGNEADLGDLPGDLSGAILMLGSHEVTTDREGFFRFPPLPPGRYRLEVRQLPARWQGRYLPPPPQVVEISRGRVQHLTLDLVPAAVLSGRILFDSQDVAAQDGLTPGHFSTGPSSGFTAGLLTGFTVEVAGADSHTRLIPDPDGRFHLGGLPAGEYRLSLWMDEPPAGPGSGGRAGPVLTRTVSLAPGEHVDLPLEIPLRSLPAVTFQSDFQSFQSKKALIPGQESPGP